MTRRLSSIKSTDLTAVSLGASAELNFCTDQAHRGAQRGICPAAMRESYSCSFSLLGPYRHVLCPWWIWSHDHAHVPNFGLSLQLLVKHLSSVAVPEAALSEGGGADSSRRAGCANGRTCSLVCAAFRMTGTVEKVMLY